MGKTHATTATSRRGLYVPREDPPPVLPAGAESFLRKSNNKRNHAHAQAMVISSAAGELILGIIGLGFVSVGLGILGLIIKSDCEEPSCCYGLIWCKKKRRRTRRGSGDSGSSDSSGDPPAAGPPPAGPVP